MHGLGVYIFYLTVKYMRVSCVLARCLAMEYSVMPFAMSTREDFSTVSHQDMEYTVITIAISMREDG